MAGGPSDPGDEPLDLEDPVDRRFRHAVEGRLQYATVESVQQLTTVVLGVKSQVEEVKKIGDSNAGAIRENTETLQEMLGWLKGGISSSGVPIPGLIAKVAVLTSAKTWVLVLLSAITVAVVTQTALSAAHTFFPAVVGGHTP